VSLLGLGQLERAQLAEAVLYPNRSIREGYRPVTAATADGRVIAGLVRTESADVLTLRGAKGRDHAVPKAEMGCQLQVCENQR
jgi:putative heme-binding domain-containing protein